MATRTREPEIVVVGASAGGVEALTVLVAALPASYGGAIFVVLHTPPGATSELPAILGRAGALPAEHARDGAAIEGGRISVAPPGSHLLVGHESVALGGGAPEHGHRPAIDALFRSAALAHGPRVTGVVLSGVLSDGTSGLQAVVAAGGSALVQDPAQAGFADMPQSAATAVGAAARILPVRAIAAALVARADAPGESRAN
jgi:two-component system, chemotaxis family, protein-glutamate methylesterase/glutaminase